MTSRLAGDALFVDVHLPPQAGDSQLSDLEEAMVAAVQEAGVATVVVGLAHVRFISSRGLGTLLSFRKRLAVQGCRLILTSLHDEVMRVFTISRLTGVFTICESDAVAAARESQLQTA